MKSAIAIAVAAGLASVLAGCGYSYQTRYAYAPAYGYTYYPSGPYYSSGSYAAASYYSPGPYGQSSTYTGSDPWWHTRHYSGIHGYPE